MPENPVLLHGLLGSGDGSVQYLLYPGGMVSQALMHLHVGSLCEYEVVQIAPLHVVDSMHLPGNT
jgi:hypothetical protein